LQFLPLGSCQGFLELLSVVWNGDLRLAMNATDLRSPWIICDWQTGAVELRECLGGRVGVYSARCPDKLTANEDAAAVIPFSDTSGVLVVADGMGGHAAGELAARTAIEQVVIAVEQTRQTGTLLRTGIINGFEQANRAVQAFGTGAATTLAAVEVADGFARPYHAGDSVILIVGSHGRVKLETTSHSPVGYGVEAGLLDAEEAMHHEHRHIVRSAATRCGSKLARRSSWPNATRCCWLATD